MGVKAWPTAADRADMNRLTDMTSDFMLAGALEKAYSYEVTLVATRWSSSEASTPVDQRT